jgi:hypothetical protein
MTNRVPARAILVLSGLLLLGAGSPAAAATEHAIIVVIDGIRPTEGFDDPTHSNVPRMWNDLRPLGAWIPEFRNDGWTKTVPGHSSIATGTWQYLANDGSQRPTSPTIFEFFRAATGGPPQTAWLVTGKDKLDVCGYSTHPAYGAPDSARTECVNRSDAATYAAYTGHLVTDHPIVSLFHLADVDITAHSGNWPGYNQAIAIADSLVYELWVLVQSDPVLAGRTSMFITCDHGRHDDAHGGFSNHGDACAGCTRIPLLALGPEIQTGMQGSIVRTQRDICPTIGALLGVPTPGVQGQVMTELWSATSEVRTAASPSARILVKPNPSSRGARFLLSAAAEIDTVRLRIWDVSGRLVHEERRAKVREMSWNARDARGRPVSAGSYFWEIEASGVRERGTLTVIR